MRALALLAASAALLGCSHLSLETQWAPAEALKYDPAKYPDDAAVGLYAEDGKLLARRASEDSYTQTLVHRAYAIQNERAFDLAEVRIPLFRKNKLVALKARHVQPDGTVREIEPSEVIVDESESKDGKSTNGRLFRFPNVQIGSVLEWVYVIESQYIDTDQQSDSLGEYPMRHYEAWIEASKQIILEERFYNVPAQGRSEAGRDGTYHRISMEVSDIPSRPKREEFAAHWTYTQPRWAYRMLRWNFGGNATPVLATWNDVIGRWARAAWATSKDALLEGFSERLDVSGCADVKCRVAKAREWVAERTEYTGIGSFARVRKGSEIVASKEASAFERGLLLRRLLEDAGVRASLAAYSAPNTWQVDPTFPALGHFNRLLVWVPAQSGLEAGLWVDPSCEACALGQVSDEARGAKALVFRAQILPVGEPVVESEDKTVEGPAFAAPTRVRRYDVTLAANGDAKVEAADERTGRWAVNRCADLRAISTQARVSDAWRELSRVAASAKLETLAPPECSAKEARAVERRVVTMPGHAVVDGDRLYVPLTLLDPQFAETFSERERLQPIAFESGDRLTEHRLKLKAPTGWAFAGSPRTEKELAPGVRAQLDVTPTPDGAEARLVLAIDAGYHEVAEYAAYRKVGEFLRTARTRVIELRRK